MSRPTDPRVAAAQFYTGLVAELYAPLVSYRAAAEEYAGFLDRSGQPALELACGTGMPMLDLVARGYEVEGLDASADMLALCRARAAERGLDVVLHHQEMQSMSLPRRYASIFLAGASFTLLPSDVDARAALARIREHLAPKGSVLIPLTLPESAASAYADPTRETTAADGSTLRLTVLDSHVDDAGTATYTRLRYERIRPDGRREELVRELATRHWPQPVFQRMLEEAGFMRITAVDPRGGKAAPDASTFVFLAQRS